MAEPTPGELSRRIDRVEIRLDGKVSLDVYTAEKIGVDQRLSNIETGLTALRNTITSTEERRQRDRKWTIGAVIIPAIGGILVPIACVLLTIYLTK